MTHELSDENQVEFNRIMTEMTKLLVDLKETLPEKESQQQHSKYRALLQAVHDLRDKYDNIPF